MIVKPIEIHRVDRGWELQTALWLPCPKEEVFPFFADARNLEAITPAMLQFRVLTPDPIEMRVGALIDYRLRLHGLPLRWRTLIREWAPPHRFVDEQLRGPYRWWVHAHEFRDHEGGTLCTDRVRYGVMGGALVHRLLVAKDVRRIFEYRAERLLERFVADAGGRRAPA